jgi:hypothetical protein
LVPRRLSLLRRLTADPRALDAQLLQAEVERLNAMPIGQVERGRVATVHGRLRSVVYTPRETVQTFTAELYDGTAAIELVWLGRRRIAGLEPGRRLTARGRVGVYEGLPAIYNPWYRLSGPA